VVSANNGWLNSNQVALGESKACSPGFRKLFNDPKVFGWFEYLYNEIKKREQQAGI
jgi:hypothetical protein